MQSTSCEMQGWLKLSLESRLPEETSITSDMQMSPPYGRKWRETKEPFDKAEKETEKFRLKLSIQKTEIMASGPITSWQTDGKTMETVTDFILLGSKITADGDCSHEIKRCLLLERKAMTNLDILKSRDITLLTKVSLVKAMVFPAVMYGCESWTIKKAEQWRIDPFELRCWRRLLRVPWQIDGEVETGTDFIFLAPKSLWTVTAAMKLRDACSLEEKPWQTKTVLKSPWYHFVNKDPYS